MRFSVESLKKLVKGACYFESCRGYLTAYKFCKNQIELTKREGYNQAWRDRTLFSGGIRLEFKTNSTLISFDYKIYKADCSFGRSNSLDVWMNGTLFSTLYVDKISGNVSINLPSGEKGRM